MEEEEKLKATRDKIEFYIDSIKQSQRNLIDVYEQLGRIVKKLPLQIADVYSDQPIELIDVDDGREGTDKTDNGEEEQ